MSSPSSLSIGGNDLLALRTSDGLPGAAARPAMSTPSAGWYSATSSICRECTARLERGQGTRQLRPSRTRFTTLRDCGGLGSEITTLPRSRLRCSTRKHSRRREGPAEPLSLTSTRHSKGHACEYVSGVDRPYSGYDVILGLWTRRATTGCPQRISTLGSAKFGGSHPGLLLTLCAS